jgi:hypothetical protein
LSKEELITAGIAFVLSLVVSLFLFPLVLFLVVWLFTFLLFLVAGNYLLEKFRYRRRKWEWK